MKESNKPCNLSETQLYMQDKFECYDELPNDIKYVIAGFLPTTDFINLSKTAKSNSPFFSTNQHLKQVYEVRKFLHHVVRGNHEAVVMMLENNPYLILIRGQVKDLSGREFTNISGFEYCLWALDKHMWKKMLDCVPKTEEGERIKAVLRTHYQKIKEHGVTYTLHGVTKDHMPETTSRTENHFDFNSTIIKKLQEYINTVNHKKWVQGVGGAQRLLPVHVVREYFSDTPFYPVPTFENQPKSSKEFENWLTDMKQSRLCGKTKLGVNSAMYRGSARCGGHASRGTRAKSQVDLNAIMELYKVRTNDFLALEEDLKPCNLSENRYNH